jgi:hypothetical protein
MSGPTLKNHRIFLSIVSAFAVLGFCQIKAILYNKFSVLLYLKNFVCCKICIPLRRTRPRWEDNIKIDLQEWDVEAWTGLLWLSRGTGDGFL